jgi:5-methylcytosine-specific restriction endonuclease McrA
LRRHAWLKAGDCTSADLRAIFAAAGGLCEYCDSAVKPRRMNKMKSTGFDHVLPMALGGRHTRTNIVVCCFACNSRKRDIHPDIFAPGLLARLAGMEAA